MQKPTAMLSPNLLCQADCFEFLERAESQTASLVYLDPPWFTGGAEWALHTQGEKHNSGNKGGPAAGVDPFSHYLDWLSNVIQQAKRIASKKGNVVIHTEPRINSYARVIAERIFGVNLVTEIILRKPRITVSQRSVPRDERENLLLCRVSDDSVYHPPFRTFTRDEVAEMYTHEDSHGRFLLTDLTVKSSRPSMSYEWMGASPPKGKSWRLGREEMDRLMSEGRIFVSPANRRPYLKSYAEESAGIPVGNIWDDLPVRVSRKERIDLVAQQPVSMLERVVATTTNESDVVVDPFCGSGTSLVAAHLNSRLWIGSDISDDAIEITRARLLKETGVQEGRDYKFVTDDGLSKYPPLARSYTRFASGLLEDRPAVRFVRNEPVTIEETRHYEFKEVKGNNPVGSIESNADVYAVAFLNGEGGRIFWGIRDEDRVTVGVSLTYRQRDDISKAVDNKLFLIQPQPGPSAWRLDFHQVYEGAGPVGDLFVVELVVPRPPRGTFLYATGRSEVYVKTDSGKKKLSFMEVQAEIINRLNSPHKT